MEPAAKRHAALRRASRRPPPLSGPRGSRGAARREPGRSASAIKRYHDRRAAEYDATTYERAPESPDAAADLAALTSLVRSLAYERVLDVGCGTGWLTQFLGGSITVVDQSNRMLARALARNPGVRSVRADVPPLPFDHGAFDLVFSSHLYSHFVSADERAFFRSECTRVAPVLVLVEQAAQPGRERESWEERRLSDGTAHSVFKRYLSAAELATEVGGSVLLENPSFVAVAAGRRAEMQSTG